MGSMPGIRQVFSRQNESLPPVKTKSSIGQSGVNQSEAESYSGQIRTQAVSPIVVQPLVAAVDINVVAVAAADEPADDDDDDLARLEARFDPKNASLN